MIACHRASWTWNVAIPTPCLILTLSSDVDVIGDVYVIVDVVFIIEVDVIAIGDVYVIGEIFFTGDVDMIVDVAENKSSWSPLELVLVLLSLLMFKLMWLGWFVL